MTKRLDPLILLRGIACFIVIWYHLRAPVSQWSFITAPNGWMAVYIFYLLSGYGVGYGFFSKKYQLTFTSLKTFYTNRFLRIAPAYYAAVLVGIFIFYPHVSVTAYDILRYFTFTMNVGYPNLPFLLLFVIISTEMQFYLVAPLLYGAMSFFLNRVHTILTAFIILLSGITIRYILFHAGFASDATSYMAHVYATVWGMIDFFLTGMLLSYIVLEKKTAIIAIKKYIPDIAFFLVLIAGFLWTNYNSLESVPWTQVAAYHMFVLPALLCVLVGWFILRAGISFHHTGKPIGPLSIVELLARPGTFFYGVGYLSYGMYLYHFAFWEILYFFPGVPNNTWPLFFLQLVKIVALSAAAALVSYALIEYPILKFRSGKP